MNNNPQRNLFRRELDILRRCRFWRQIIENPTTFYPDATAHPYAAAQYRRDAKRNLQKLLRKYPQIAERLQRETATEALR